MASGAKTTFFFFSSPGNNNGTSVEDGQIPEIIYYSWTRCSVIQVHWNKETSDCWEDWTVLSASRAYGITSVCVCAVCVYLSIRCWCTGMISNVETAWVVEKSQLCCQKKRRKEAFRGTKCIIGYEWSKYRHILETGLRAVCLLTCESELHVRLQTVTICFADAFIQSTIFTFFIIFFIVHCLSCIQHVSVQVLCFGIVITLRVCMLCNIASGTCCYLWLHVCLELKWKKKTEKKPATTK